MKQLDMLDIMQAARKSRSEYINLSVRKVCRKLGIKIKKTYKKLVGEEYHDH